MKKRRIAKSAKKPEASLDPVWPDQKPAYRAAIELCSIRKMALKEALAEMYGIGGER